MRFEKMDGMGACWKGIPLTGKTVYYDNEKKKQVSRKEYLAGLEKKKANKGDR